MGVSVLLLGRNLQVVLQMLPDLSTRVLCSFAVLGSCALLCYIVLETFIMHITKCGVAFLFGLLLTNLAETHFLGAVSTFY